MTKQDIFEAKGQIFVNINISKTSDSEINDWISVLNPMIESYEEEYFKEHRRNPHPYSRTKHGKRKRFHQKLFKETVQRNIATIRKLQGGKIKNITWEGNKKIYIISPETWDKIVRAGCILPEQQVKSILGKKTDD